MAVQHDHDGQAVAGPSGVRVRLLREPPGPARWDQLVRTDATIYFDLDRHSNLHEFAVSSADGRHVQPA